MHDLLLPPGGALAADPDIGLHLLQLLRVHFEICNHLQAIKSLHCLTVYKLHVYFTSLGFHNAKNVHKLQPHD